MRLPITRRLFIGLILLPAFTLGASTWFSYDQTSQTVDQLVDSTSQTALKQLEQSFTRIIDDTKKDTTLLAGLPFNRADGTLPNYTNQAKQPDPSAPPTQKASDIYSVLEKYGSSKIENSFIQYADIAGGYLNWPKQAAASGYDPRKEDWYKQALDNSSTVIMSEPHYDAATKLSIIGFSKATLDAQANIKGVLSIYKSIDRLAEDMKRIEIGQKGFVFSYTQNGKIVTHPNKNYFFKNVTQMKENGKPYFSAPKAMMEQESGSTIMNVAGTKSVVIWQTSSKTGFKLAVVLDYASLYAPKEAMLSQSLINFIVAIALATLIAWLIGRSINRPLSTLRQEALAIASGDLRTPKRPKRFIRDELTDLAENFDAMRARLRQTILALTTSATTVRDASAELSTNATHVQTASLQIGRTMEEIAAAGETQTKQAERSSHAVHGVKERSTAMQHVASTTLSEVSTVASAAVRGSDVTKQTIADLLDHSVSLEQEIQNTSDFLGKRSDEIAKVLGTLQTISSQTNLLALNAAIEAARVGEQGRGFAVVASEVRKLAEESDASAKQIKQLLDHIQNETQTAMSAMHHVMDDLKRSLDSVQTTGDDFEQIAGSVQHVSRRTEELTSDIHALTQATEEVSDAMGTILALTEENAAGLETSSASIQETNATLESVTSAATHLAKIAGNLHQLTLDFQLDDSESSVHDSVEEDIHSEESVLYEEAAVASLDEEQHDPDSKDPSSSSE